MHWVDVAGPPGSGKSTLCDALWSNHAIGWDGKNPPIAWAPFIEEVDRLFGLIKGHPTLTAAYRMNVRSLKKMSTVSRLTGMGRYVHTGLVQRLIGFGWRLHHLGKDVKETMRAFELMPASIGVAFLEVDLETLLERNRAREKVPETAHENRSHQVLLMQEAIQAAKDALYMRRVPTVEISTDKVPSHCRNALIGFSYGEPFDPEAGNPTEDLMDAMPDWWA